MFRDVATMPDGISSRLRYTGAVRVVVDTEAAALAHDAALVAPYREALLAVEWGPAPTLDMSECPYCLNTRKHGHMPDCAVRALLAGEAKP